jgi:glyoxylase-like metal-dependent hydrolase (beta-lactamase superfamily II)
MIVERAEHPGWLSNAYLVAEGAGGSGVLIDGNGVVEPLLERIERDGIGITHVLLTHHHGDHVVGVAELARRFDAPLVAHPLTAAEVAGVDEALEDGATIRSGGRTGYPELRRSIMETLMGLPHETRVHPGHTVPTTIGEEWQENPFVRLWRGLDQEGDEPCRVAGREARLVLWADDYDGTYKAWVRIDGRDEIVGGSQVEREGA